MPRRELWQDTPVVAWPQAQQPEVGQGAVMLRLVIKQLHLPLFGMVESWDRQPFRDAVAGGRGTATLFADQASLDVVAQDLELEAHGLFADAARYAAGQFGHGTLGLEGSRLQELGLALTYLIRRCAGHAMEPVVPFGVRAGPAATAALSHPHFVTVQDGRAGVVQVCTRQALDVVPLTLTRQRKQLAVCDGLRTGRADALRALGYASVRRGNKVTPVKARRVPFPAGFGLTAAVMMQDGRAQRLAADGRFRPPVGCHQLGRHCFSCLRTAEGQPHDLWCAQMEDGPQQLPLVAASADHDAWLASYRTWRQSIWSEEAGAVIHASAALADRTHRWLTHPQVAAAERQMLGPFWAAYLREAAAERGVRLDANGQHAALAALGDALPHRPGMLDEPRNRVVSFAELAAIWPAVCANRVAVRFSVSEPREHGGDSLAAGVDAAGWYVTLLPRQWWDGRTLSDRDADGVASRLLARALALARVVPLSEAVAHAPIPLRRAVVTVDDTEFRAGWVPQSMARVPGAWKDATWWVRNLVLLMDPVAGERLWPLMLASGMSGVRLAVFKDGRARLHVPHPERVGM